MKYFILLFFISSQIFAHDAPLPEGISNDQNPEDKTISPQESLKRITVPEGFHVSLFAGEPDLSQPIAFTFDDRGRLWVVQNFSHPYFKEVGHDRVLIFEDTDGDGQFDKKKTFWDKGEYVTGIQYGHGGVWLCNSPKLQFIPDRNGDDIPDSEPITVLDGWNIQGKNNVFNNLNWGPDGWLYGCIGQNGKSMVGAPSAKEEERVFMSRGIWRYHPIHKTFEVVARGAVNPWGLDFDDYGEGFFTNCVLAHAWHLIPGAFYQRRGNETDFPNIYGRIPPIADHLHWAGGHWTSSRSGKGIAEKGAGHSDFGGGHAHTGCMIYMGGNWPKKYRGTLLVGNIHGNRLNNDILKRQGSSYVASHAKDFLFGNHPWFRSLSQKYGHDGGVYISDWHDYGECHDHDGTHRTSGRIYKVTYGKVQSKKVNLQAESSLKLVDYQLNENEWYSRHARRLLQERALQGEDMKGVHKALNQIFDEHESAPKKLRALWCLYVTSGLSEADYIKLLSHPHESVRSWSLRLMMDDKKVDAKQINALEALAYQETSPLVRLHLASQLQKIPAVQRGGILLALIQRAEDHEDRMLPKMLYYASMDLVAQDLSGVETLLMKSELPLFTEYLSRLLITNHVEKLDQMVAIINDAHEPKAMIRGIYESLLRKQAEAMPSNWPTAYAKLLKHKDEELRLQATLLALKFKDLQAEKMLMRFTQDKTVSLKIRKKSLDALIKANSRSLTETLLSCLSDSVLQLQAIQGLAQSNEIEAATELLNHYHSFDKPAREALFTTLCSREPFALKLFEAIDAGKASPEYLNSFHLRQLKLFKNQELKGYLQKFWGDVKPSSKDKEKQLAKYKRMLSTRFISEGDVKNGKVIFARMCGACHKLFGEGGVVGPDLTGSGRKDVHYLLENMVDPSQIVSQNYRLVTVMMKDKRVITGTIAEENNSTVTVSSLNEKIILNRSEIERLDRSKQSIMPEGLLNAMDKNQLRDLVKYLQQ